MRSQVSRQQRGDRDQRDDPGRKEISGGVKDLGEHGRTQEALSQRRLGGSPRKDAETIRKRR
jgi:hypothetical protein